jgi:tetratricopeptide (TPR) repeat protein
MDFQDKRLDGARIHVAAALAADPGNVTALSAAGDIELRAGSYAAALDKYGAVLDVDPDNLLALTSSASLRVLNNQLDQALSLAQHAVELAPDNPRAQDTLAWVYYRLGNYRTATEYLKKAVSKEPTAPRQYHLALAYLKDGQTSLAAGPMQAALQKDPDLPKKDQGW